MAFVKVPVPEDVHCTVEYNEADDPAVMLTEVSVAHMVTGVPAVALGFPIKVSVFCDVTFPEQGVCALAVKVKITLPAVLSAALGE